MASTRCPSPGAAVILLIYRKLKLCHRKQSRTCIQAGVACTAGCRFHWICKVPGMRYQGDLKGKNNPDKIIPKSILPFKIC